MATLQKIRSKGPLLLIVIGLAMLAFILGDAWKIIRPNQGVQYVGSVDGVKISAMDFQKELENYTEVVKFTMQGQELTEEMNNSLKDQTWSMMVRNAILEKACNALGITVTDAEVRAVIELGQDPVLQNTPFNNADGKFDADNLKAFIAGYTTIDRSTVAPEEMAYYDSMYRYWLFIENDIKSGLLFSKYASLINASIISNSIAADQSFKDRVERYDILMASLPFSSVSDEDVTMTTSDLKKVYEDVKESLRVYSENRDIYYIDYAIEPSDADRQALLAEVNEITTQLEEQTEDFGAFVSRSGSVETFSQVARSAKNLPEDVVAKLDSVNRNGVFGPYYDAWEDSYTTFKVLGTSNGYDSIQFALIQVVAEDEAEIARLSDSIYNAIKKGADFKALAEKYGQSGEAQWLGSDSYEPASITGDNALYLNKLNSMKKGELANLKVTGSNLIIKVTDVKTPVKKYNVAIVKRPVEFSSETSNDAYNKLSLFLAQNTTLDELKASADDSEFHLLHYTGFESYSNNVAGVAKSHDALRWAFGAQQGEISNIYEAGNANDHLLVVAIDKIHPKGYLSIEDAKELLYLDALNNKKFEVLQSKLAGKTFDELKSIEGISIDTIPYLNFTNYAYVSSSKANETVVGPSVNKLEVNELTKPIKGSGCAFVAKKLNAEANTVEFNAASEKLRLQTIATRQLTNSQRIFDELFIKADVEDTRYKIF